MDTLRMVHSRGGQGVLTNLPSLTIGAGWGRIDTTTAANFVCDDAEVIEQNGCGATVHRADQQPVMNTTEIQNSRNA